MSPINGIDHDIEESDIVHYLPEHIIGKILINLPVKSLLRVRCVCKSWRNITVHSNFIQQYNVRGRVRHRLKNSFLLQQLINPSCHRCLVAREDQFFQVFIQHWDIQLGETIVHSASAGLLCCESWAQGGQFFVCNPTTREFIELPRANSDIGTCCIAMVAQTSEPYDYQVVRLSNYEHSDSILKCEVFNSHSWMWRLIRIVHLHHGYELDTSSSVLVNGVFHWIVHINIEDEDEDEDEDENGSPYILALHIDGTGFGEIIGPRLEWASRIAESEGNLCVVYDLDIQFEVWVLRDFVKRDWFRKYVVNLETIAVASNWHCLGLLEENMFIEKDKKDLYFYYVKSGRFMEIEPGCPVTEIDEFLPIEYSLLPCKRIVRSS
ncbi:hypothetical protein AMTRI_Chr12g240140 [Amborella trichopoda]